MTCMTLGSYAHLIMHLVSGLSMFNHKRSRMYSCPVVQKKTWLLYLRIIWKRAHRHQPNSSVAVLFFLQKMVAAFKSQICFLHAPTRWAFTRTPLHDIWTSKKPLSPSEMDQMIKIYICLNECTWIRCIYTWISCGWSLFRYSPNGQNAQLVWRGERERDLSKYTKNSKPEV